MTSDLSFTPDVHPHPRSASSLFLSSFSHPLSHSLSHLHQHLFRYSRQDPHQHPDPDAHPSTQIAATAHPPRDRLLSSTSRGKGHTSDEGLLQNSSVGLADSGSGFGLGSDPKPPIEVAKTPSQVGGKPPGNSAQTPPPTLPTPTPTLYPLPTHRAQTRSVRS